MISCWRACSIAPRIPEELLGVIMMPSTPWAMRFSIAATWPSLSPSNLPARAVSSTPCSCAAAVAASRIVTKNGFVSVLVMSPTLTSPPAAAPVSPSPAVPADSGSSPPHAATVNSTAAAVVSAEIRRNLVRPAHPRCSVIACSPSNTRV